MSDGSGSVAAWWHGTDAALKSLAGAWLRKAKLHFEPKTRAKSKPPFRRTMLFEMLEQRILLSASLTPLADVSGGVLTTSLGADADHVLMEQIGGNATDGFDIRISVGAYDPETYSGVSSVVADGKGGDDSFKFVGVTTPVSLTGGAGTDILLGSDTNNTWAIASSGAGTLNTNISFTSVEELTGGSGVDVFAFADGAALSGTIDGGAGGADTLDLSAVAADTVFTFRNNGTVAVTDFTNVLNPSTGIDAVIGGTKNNRFVFENAASFDGSIDGGTGGTNSIDLSAYSTPVLMDLEHGTSKVGGFIDGVTMQGLTADMPLRYLNNGAGVGKASVAEETLLSVLNNGAGVGVVVGADLQITLTNGVTVDVDLSAAVTVGDVLEAINGADHRLYARLNTPSNGIDLSDSAGGSGALTVVNLNSSTTATDLGLAGNSTDNLLEGQAVVTEGSVTLDTTLGELNDGSGVDVVAGYDLRITLTNGAIVDVELSAASTIGDVLEAINSVDSRLDARLNPAANGIDLSDSAGGSGALTVGDLNGSATATDLGLRGSSTDNLLDGRPVVNDFRITLTDGSAVTVNIGHAVTVGDVLAAI
jgi:hypothetical protein